MSEKNFKKLDPEALEELYDPDMRPTNKGGGGKRAKKTFKDQYGPTGGTRAANQKIAEANKLYIRKKRPKSK